MLLTVVTGCWVETSPVFGNLQRPQVAVSCEPRLRAGLLLPWTHPHQNSPEEQGIRRTFLVGLCS